MTQTMNTKPIEKWHELVEKNVAYVKYVVNRYWNTPAKNDLIEKEEVFNESLLALCRAAKKYVESGDTREFQNFAFTAIKNNIFQMARDRLRNKRTWEEGTHVVFISADALISRYEDETAVIDNKDYCNRLIAKSTMSKQDRAILELYYWQGMTYREIAESLGMDINEVSYHLQSAKKSIKEAAQSLVY